MFVNRLLVGLELNFAGTKFEIPGGNIKNFHAELGPHGFTVSLDFWFICLKAQSEDKIFAKFIADDLIEAKLSIDRKFDKVGATTEALVLNGYVEDRSVTERSFEGIAGEPVLQRHYRLTFCDRAQVLWRQHFPLELFTDKSLKELIDAHVPTNFKLKHAWTASSAKHPVLSLPLGTEDGTASFYDYITWLLDQHGAFLYFDYDKATYEISDKKKEYAKVQVVDPADVETLEAELPRIDRATVAILNGNTEIATKKKEVTNANKVTKLRRDFLIRSSVAADLTTRATRETARHKAFEPFMGIEFAGFPSFTIRPNGLFKFTDFPSTIYQSKHQYRSLTVEIKGRAESQEATDDAEDPSNSYELTYRMRLEKKENARFEYPAYEKPLWPIYVEGKVVSEVGKEDEGTYQAYKDKDTQADLYKVSVPLWKKQKVVLPYNPNMLDGHFYFPLYKDARVLLSLEYDAAWISRFMDWRPGARLPAESQGNHILLGKKATDETSMSHVYKDAKPVLTILRTSTKDKQTLQISEGTIRLETLEEKE